MADFAPQASRHRLAVDTGGTFIDYVLLDELTGAVTLEKEPARRSSLVDCFAAGAQRLPVALSEVDQIFHGTTVVINAVLQERGAMVGLLTTAGFRDVLEIGRGARTEMYNFSFLPPRPLVPRELRREVPERIGSRGEVVTPLDLEALDREIDELLAHGVQAVCVAFVNAYANPEHERLAAERITARSDVTVTISSDLTREWREFERTSTAVLNAFVQPEFSAYARALDSRLRDAGFSGALAIMQSSGGVARTVRAAQMPIRTLASGPAGGVIGAQVLGERLGCANVICADVGGTSFDVALIEHGRVLEQGISVVGGRPVLGSAMDIVSIGTGCGSIAWIDERAALRVGPHSAGAEPGPACFGLGGTEPTVTDCELLLGRLRPDGFLGARMTLDVPAARKAVEDALCSATALTVEQAAMGTLQIAETNMAYAIRSLTVERGKDPRDFTVIAYGGGGGFFGAAVAEEIGISEVIVPVAAANFSAWGLLNCDYREDAARTAVRPLDDDAGLDDDFDALGEQARARLREFDIDAGSISTRYAVELRFAGQEHTLTVAVPEQRGSRLVADITDAFVQSYRGRYGHGDAGAPVEVVTVRARAVGRVHRPRIAEWRPAGAPMRSTRAVYFASTSAIDTLVVSRQALAVDELVQGPAIVEEWNTTTVIPPGWSCRTDELGNLRLRREAPDG